MLLAKAWDNRIGCAIAIDVLKQLKDEKHQMLYMALELYKKKLVFVAQKHLRIILNQISRSQ